MKDTRWPNTSVRFAKLPQELTPFSNAYPNEVKDGFPDWFSTDGNPYEARIKEQLWNQEKFNREMNRKSAMSAWVKFCDHGWRNTEHTFWDDDGNWCPPPPERTSRSKRPETKGGVKR